MTLSQIFVFHALVVGSVLSQSGGQLRSDEVFQAYSPGQYIQPVQSQLVANKNGQLLRAYPASALKRLRLVPVSPEEGRGQVLYSLSGQGQEGQRLVYPDPQQGLEKRPTPIVRPHLKAIPVNHERLRGVPSVGGELGREEEAEEEYPSDPNPQYNFSFDVKDDELTNYQNRQEERDGGVIKGSYSVVDPDGYVRTVTYTADAKNGFQAKVVREPTDVKVKFPVVTPSPEEEQRKKVKSPVRIPYPQFYASEEQNQQVYARPAQAHESQLQNPYHVRRVQRQQQQQ